ncbi:MAG: haloacid dehalogenase type II [Fimbriimonas sp.]|nr:haloacid dehalogenase type II [Fimbriimonas sp.]
MIVSLIAAWSLVGPIVGANAPQRPRFKAVAFDYFVLFQADSVASKVEREFPGRGLEFTRAWRAKQFDYGFLRSITHRHEDFFQITADALDYTAQSLHLRMDPEARSRLLTAYLSLTPWPDTVSAMRTLRSAGVKIVTIANFSPMMLRSNADRVGVRTLFDGLLSTEANGTLKPEAQAYALGMKALHLRKSEIVFAAFGGWDVFGAKSFGYPTFWVNRANAPLERLGVKPDGQSADLSGLIEFVLGRR